MNLAKKIVIIVSVLWFLSLSALTQNIFEAVDKGDIEKVKILMSDDPECINLRDKKSGHTPLHRAALKGRTAICNLLIDKGADIHAVDNLQATPLHLASYGGHPELIRIFIAKGLDANIRNNDAYPPIVWAIYGKKINSIDELLKNGAHLHPSLRIGRGILHLAAANGNAEVIEYLLNKGMKVDVKSGYGNTPLFWAILSKNCHNAEVLIKNGANLNISNNEGHTPITLAVSKNDTKMVGLLSASGVNIKKANSSGHTYLHAAVYNNHKEMVSLLLEKGVNPNITNNKGFTALDLAISRNWTALQKLLQAHGAKLSKGIEKSIFHLSRIGKAGSGLKKSLKVTIVYDNYVYQKGLEADWGFSCYIEGTKKNILFDTGTKSSLFIRNLKALDIDHQKVDLVVISHEHGDHTGGLFAFLKMNHDLSVIVPFSFSYHFVSRVESYGARILTVKSPVEICKHVYLSGELGQRIKEQSLAINTKKGLVIICGCSHPGIIDIIKKFKEILNRNIYLVFGGFHLMGKTDREMTEIIKQMKELGVRKCGATHCTGDRQIEMIKKAFGDNYVTMGVGRILTIE